VPSPHDLAPYDLLIKIAVASFCHTDMMLLDGDMEREWESDLRTLFAA
jgi:D-arabinose 1-dehydrogenase-like Zn-dependent alcohol dehydrogenase